MAKRERIIESPYTALVVATIVGGLALSGKFTVTATHVLLALSWVVIIVVFRGQPTVPLICFGAICGSILMLLGYWFTPDPVPGYSGVLSPKINTILRGGSIPGRRRTHANVANSLN
jgi:hypothetical protein